MHYGLLNIDELMRLLCGVAFCLLVAWVLSRFAMTRKAFGMG